MNTHPVPDIPSEIRDVTVAGVQIAIAEHEKYALRQFQKIPLAQRQRIFSRLRTSGKLQ